MDGSEWLHSCVDQLDATDLTFKNGLNGTCYIYFITIKK